MAKNTTLEKARRFLGSMNDEQRQLYDRAYDAAVEFGDYDPAGFAAKGIIESRFNPGVVNGGGFTGLYQIDTQGGKGRKSIVLDDLVEQDLITRAEADRIDLKNPRDNMRVALLYRKRLFDALGSPEAADIAYNAGITKVKAAMKVAKSNSAADIAQAIARISKKGSIYKTQKKIDEITNYQPTIAALSPLINEERAARGLSVSGQTPLQSALPAYAAGPSQLPGQAITPPGVPEIPGAPTAPPPDPLGGATNILPNAVDAGQIGLETQQAQAPQNRLPLPTEAPDLRNALSQLSGGGLSYNIPLGSQFDNKLLKSPLSPLDNFLDNLLDTA